MIRSAAVLGLLSTILFVSVARGQQLPAFVRTNSLTDANNPYAEVWANLVFGPPSGGPGGIGTIGGGSDNKNHQDYNFAFVTDFVFGAHDANVDFDIEDAEAESTASGLLGFGEHTIMGGSRTIAGKADLIVKPATEGGMGIGVFLFNMKQLGEHRVTYVPVDELETPTLTLLGTIKVNCSVWYHATQAPNFVFGGTAFSQCDAPGASVQYTATRTYSQNVANGTYTKRIIASWTDREGNFQSIDDTYNIWAGEPEIGMFVFDTKSSVDTDEEMEVYSQAYLVKGYNSSGAPPGQSIWADGIAKNEWLFNLSY